VGELDHFADKDLLLIASGNNQPLLQTWRKYMPVQPHHESSFKLFGMELNPFHWALTSAVAAQPINDTLFESATSRAVMLGFESPLARGRSAVLLWGAQPDDLNAALLAMADGDGVASQVKGAVSVIRGKSIDTVEANSVYYVGSLPWLTQVRWRLSENLPLFFSISLLSTMLLACMVYFALKHLAKRRLV